MILGMKTTNQKKDGPEVPDPYQTADAQLGLNRETSLYNTQLAQIDRNNPFGSVTYTGTPGQGDNAVNVNLNPRLQTALSSAMNRLPTSGIDTSGLNPLPSSDSYADYTNQLTQDTFDRGMTLMQPYFEDREKQLDTRLVNQGIPVGSEAYGDAYQNQIADPRMRAENQLMLDAMGAGRDEHQRLSTLDLMSRNQGYGELQDAHRQPFRDISSLMPMIPSTPGSGASGIGTPDLAGLIGDNYAIESANQQAQKQGTSSLLGTVGMLAMMSDPRTKTDKKLIGKHKDYNLYSFKYLGSDEEQIGVMADEVKEINPAAVVTIDGIDHVNYGAL